MGSLQEGSFSVGPWGGIGGNQWSFFASRGISRVAILEGHVNKVREEQAQDRDGMIIKSISFKDSDGFEYGVFGDNSKDSKDQLLGRSYNQGMVKRLLHEVYFGKKRKEFLKYITGTFGSVDGMMGMAITSISFITNKQTYGPFGNVSGTHFSTFRDKTLIVGFYGRSNNQYLEALGVYLMPRHIDENISVGPWGRTGRKEWSFKPSQAVINRIVIHHTEQNIQAISFPDAEEKNSTKFGNDDPEDNETLIEIDTSSEYLTSVTGTWTPKRGITSLTFVANNQTYGPFGSASGDPFSLPIEDSEVVGFHGRGDNHLDALGYFVKPRSPETKITMGPWGGGGGDKWIFIPTDGLNEVTIRYEGAVFSIAFRDTGGLLSQIFGGQDPGEFVGTRKVIDIDWPSEYLTSISGSYGDYKDNLVITSLSFKTNWNSYGPYGRVYGTNFSSETDNCVIVGFLGCAGYFLDSIGIYARPLHVMNKSSEVSGNGDEQEKCKTEEGKDDDELPGNTRERTASLQTGTKESTTEASTLTSRTNRLDRIKKIPTRLQECFVNLTQPAMKAMGKGGDKSTRV